MIVSGALALAAVPSTALAGAALARELEPYQAGLVLAKPGAGPALREAGGERLATALPIWRVPTRPALRVLPGLLSSHLVSEVTPDQPLSTLSAMPREGEDWWIPFVRANGAVPPGPGKPLTIIDTGVDLTHPEFAGRPNTTALNRQSTSGQNEEHGTAVASVAAAPQNGIGVVGVYPQANLNLWDASPLGIGITAGDVIRGLNAAIHTGQGVVNLSLGSEVRNPLLDRMIAVTQSSGTLVVAAAGNSRQNGSPPEYPAALPHVLTVGALDQTSQPTFFTTGSSHVDLSAPGERIWVAVPPSLHPPDYYDQFDGTSFSSPMVAAASAWVWTARPTLDASQVFDVMRASAQDVWTPGFDSFTGFGRLDIPTALTVAPPPRDPQEPNEDVSYVKPGGFLHRSTTPLTTARHKSGSIAARLDRGDDPRDVYRLWVPAGKSVSVALQPTGGDADLALWGPQTESVLEAGRALKRDARGISERSGTKRERLRVRNTGRTGAYFFAEASFGGGKPRAAAGISYLLSASIVTPKKQARH
ncbi:MAG TPA: S8 family serine peptidase [Gaiellaceae bacterium]|nr:S8 family serine peptidase [Gaiellaceae bacterium]